MSVYWSVILEEYQYEEIDFENDSEQVDGTHVKQQHLVSMDMYVSIIYTFFLRYHPFILNISYFSVNFALRCKKKGTYLSNIYFLFVCVCSRIVFY